MWLKLIYWALVLLASYITFVVIKELIPYLRYTLYYKSQSIEYNYVPFLGWYGLYQGKKDELENFRILMNKTFKNKEIIAVNEFEGTNLVFMLNSPDLIKEFFVKEIEYTKKTNIMGDDDASFFFKSGKRALDSRSVFNNFFKPENLKKITQELREIFDEKFQKLKDKIIAESKEKKIEHYNMRNFYSDAFSEVVNRILIGQKETPIVNGISLTQAVERLMTLQSTQAMFHPLIIFSFGLLGGLRLIKAERDLYDFYVKINKKIGEIIDKREKAKFEDLGNSVLDLMIKYNLKAENEEGKITRKEMISNIMAFQVAGMDTSRATSESIINFVSLNQEKKLLLTEEILPEIWKLDKFKYETYDSSEKLQNFISESLRLFGPADMIFPRQITKDLKLGKYVLKKGSKVMIPIHSLQNSEKNFNKEREFDEKRFEKENEKNIGRNVYMPFSNGRRGCIGKYFGLLMICTNLTAFFENFEVLKGYEAKRMMRFVYGVDNCFVDLKVK